MTKRKQVPKMSHQSGPSASLRPMLAAVAAWGGLLTILGVTGPLAPHAAASMASRAAPRVVLSARTMTSQAAPRVVLSARTMTSQAAPRVALSARTFSLDERGDLHLTSKRGFTLNEEGPASGTVSGTIYVHLKIISSTHVGAEISIYPNSGSITCQGTASYHREVSSADFSGSLSIERGTGNYDHAQGAGLNFSGTIQRSNDAITVHVGGTASD
jgi:hypothetical protein